MTTPKKKTSAAKSELKPRTGDKKKISARLFKVKERTSAVDMVIEKFKELLKSGELRAGDRIPSETELADSLHTSRSSIREAVKSLAGFGILEVKRGDGTYVSSTMSNSLFDHLIFHLLASNYDKRNLIEFREMLEYGVVAQAIKNISQDDLAMIKAAHEDLEKMLRSGDISPEALYKAETRFHFSISRATHNPLVEKIYNFTFELFQPTIMRTHEKKISTDVRGTIQATHSAILESLEKRDHNLAQKAVDLSIETWSSLMD